MKRVDIKDLKVGMHVVDTGLSWLDHPFLYSMEGEIKDRGALDKIREEGFLYAFINPALGSWRDEGGPSAEEQMALAADQADDAGPEGEGLRRFSYAEEFVFAKKLYSDSIDFAKEFVRGVRLGELIDYERAGELIENLIESVLRNHDAIVSLTKLRAFDEYTYTHSINVAVLSVAFGRQLGLGRAVLRDLGAAGIFHDIGKELIPKEILNKPGKLTSEEFEVIKSHSVRSMRLLRDLECVPERVLRGAAEHHEKFNGMGYPMGLKGGMIAPLARILAVSDVYDALTSERVYKKGILPNKALSIMFGMRDEDFFPGYVDRFIKSLGIYPVGSLVRLSNSELAVVSASNPKAPLFPEVRIILDPKLRSKIPETVDLAADTRFGPEGELKIVECLDPKRFKIDPANYLI